jgi:ankyrin repeat protein
MISADDSALYDALCEGNLKVVEQRLDAGLDVNAVVSDGTLLQVAAYSGQVGAVALLLDRGANPSAKNENGYTAIHLATWYSKLDVIRLLLDRGVPIEEPDGNGYTPLHRAADDAKVEVVQFLLERGANPNARDESGQTPLENALFRNDLEITRALLEGGADPTLPSRDDAAPIESAMSVATFELVRDAVWARAPDTKIALPWGMLMKLFDAQWPQAVACYQRVVPRPSASEFGFYVGIEPDGTVSRVVPARRKQDVTDQGVVDCILSLVRTLSFPKSSQAREGFHVFTFETPPPSD